MVQSRRYVDSHFPIVWRLNRALYGSKQAPMLGTIVLWYLFNLDLLVLLLILLSLLIARVLHWSMSLFMLTTSLSHLQIWMSWILWYLCLQFPSPGRIWVVSIIFWELKLTLLMVLCFYLSKLWNSCSKPLCWMLSLLRFLLPPRPYLSPWWQSPPSYHLISIL